MTKQALPSDTKWIFPLTKGSFQDTKGLAAPIMDEIQTTFPVGFILDQKAKFVRFRFENDDGSFWGGKDTDLIARFDEFFEWKWTNPRNGLSQPTRWHRPSWLTFRAWQLLRSEISRRTWDDVQPSELTIEILKTRKSYFDEGMYQEHGFPARLILTLE